MELKESDTNEELVLVNEVEVLLSTRKSAISFGTCGSDKSGEKELLETPVELDLFVSGGLGD